MATERTALVAAALFLALNGLDLAADDVDVVPAFLALAAGETSEEELAAWIDRDSRERER